MTAWKLGDEYLPFHPDASHINPDYRDGWNACYYAAVVPAWQAPDEGCICQGNWRLIVSEVNHLIGKKFRSYDGKEFGFFGLVHADDDYYYGMWHKDHGLRLLSCVGNLESWNYTLIEEATIGVALPDGGKRG